MMNAVTIGRDDVQDIYALTPFQEGLLYHDMLERDGAAPQPYFQQLTFRMRGQLDLAAFERAFAWLIARHDMLRTVFRTGGADRPLQIVLKHRPFRLDRHDLSGLSANAQRAAIETHVAAERRNPFDLRRDLLLRVNCLTLSPTLHFIIWSFHHILVDGWCIGILQEDMAVAYAAFAAGHEPARHPAQQFGRHVVWAERRRGEHALAYWASYLAGYEPRPLLPLRRAPSAARPRSDNSIEVPLGPQLGAQLLALARREGVTPSLLLQALWGVLLAKHNGQRDVTFGAVVSTRSPDVPGSDTMVGPCIVMLPLRVRFEAAASLRDLLRELRAQAADWLANSHCALADIQARCRAGAMLFDHYVVFENFPLDQRFRGAVQQFAPGLAIEDIDSFITTNYEFYVLARSGAALDLELHFNGGSIDRSAAMRLAARLRQLAAELVEDSGKPLDAVSIQLPHEAEAINNHWSRGAAPAPLADTVAAARARLLGRVGERPAVRVGEQIMNHQALQDAAEALARGLRDRFGVTPAEPVAIWTPASADTIVAMLGCLLLGVPFVPLDPAAPASRNAHILADCGARLIVATGDDGPNVTCTTTVAAAEITSDSTEPLPATSGAAPAYIIYTSGTTGVPKRVQITQAALLNYVGWLARDVGIGAEDRTALVTSAAYDLGYTALFGAILLGGCLTLIGEAERRDPQQLIAVMRAHALTWLKATPSFFGMLLAESADQLGTATSLRLILSGGERQRFGDLRRLRAALPQLTIYNHYGPTETTIGCIAGVIDADLLAQSDPPQRLGRPIAGTRVMLCDHALMPVPPGTPGEIVVMGAGLADHAAGDAGIERERFVTLPCAGNAPAYRTGDWGEWLADGSIAFHGRRDDQIKVRGHRVALGEVERALGAVAGVGECAIVPEPTPEGDIEMIAFFAPQGSASPTPTALRTALATVLPEPMVPGRFVPLTRLPLTINGKVDRAALRAEGARLAPVAKPGAAEHGSPLEEELRRIWAEILFQEHVGLDDDFFSLGGHSIKAVLLVSRVRKQLKQPLIIRELFDHPTVRRLAQHMADRERSGGGLLALRAAPTSAPVALFLPPVLGSSTVYKELIDHFEGELACYGVQCPGFDNDEPAAGSLPALADLFMRSAENLSGSTPLRLVGWSMGAHLALELAERLERRGRALRLVLIDSAPRLGDAAVQNDEEAHFADLGELAQQPYWGGVLAKLTASLSADERRRLEQLALQNQRLFQNYAFSGTVAADLFCIEALDNPAAADMGRFGRITSGRCIVQRVPGDHYSLFQPPNLQEAARRIERALLAP